MTDPAKARQAADATLAQRKTQSNRAWLRRWRETAFAVMVRGMATRKAAKQTALSDPPHKSG